MEMEYISEEESSSDESSSEDDSIVTIVGQAIMNSNSWIWDSMQVCAMNLKEVKNDRPMSGREYIRDILEGHHERSYENFRMSAENFMILKHELEQKGLVSSGDVMIEEQLGMFLQIVGHSHTIRKVGEDFQHSTETVWRCFNNVLRKILRMRRDYVKLPGADAPVHAKVSEGTSHEAFKGALGAIDGTHIPAFPDPGDKEPERFRNKKHFYSQNVMAAVDFDGNFVAVVSGWEGSAHDNLVLRKAIDKGFVVPPDRYYLVDLGYANNRNFMCPYRGRPYHLGEYRGRNCMYNCLEDLFNHRHAQLRNIVEKTFGILKIRFKILQLMRRYKFKIQARVVVACCILHNFINRQNMIRDVSDESWLDEQQMSTNVSDGDTGIEGDLAARDTEVGADLRERIKNDLWANM